MGVGNLPFNLSDIQTELGSTTDTLSGLGLEATPQLTTPFNMSEFENYVAVIEGYYRNDGVNDYGQITGGASTNQFGSGRLSVSFWVKQNAGSHHNAQMLNFAPGFSSSDRIMIDYNTGAGGKLRFNHRQGSGNNLKEYYLNNGGNNSKSGTGGNWQASNKGNTNGQGWTLLTVTYDGAVSGVGGVNFWWNDQQLDHNAQATNGSRSNLAATNLRVGENIHNVGSAGNAAMDFDKICVYSSILSASEIQNIYNNGPKGATLGTPHIEINFNNNTFTDEGTHFSNNGTVNNGGSIQSH